jgi:hypothetical protein
VRLATALEVCVTAEMRDITGTVVTWEAGALVEPLA